MVHLIKNIFLIILILFAGIQSLFATDYFCDPENGNIDNIGSQSNPWGSLASVFEEGKQFEAGDKIHLLSGDHGDVIVIGENTKYIKVDVVKGEKAIVNSIVFGTDTATASRWSFSNIIFNNSSKESVVFVHLNSTKIRILSSKFLSENESNVGIKINGSQCKVESNRFKNFKTAIIVSGQKNQVRNNRIEYFNKNAVEVSGDYNLFEYNLIKESVAKTISINSGFYLNDDALKGNVFRGNTIINFVSTQRDNLGKLNGIFSDISKISETIIENNVILSNSENGISLNGEVTNSKIVNNTVVNPYFGLDVLNSNEINTPIAIKIIGNENSTGLVIRNNLTNDLVFEKVKGLADYNLTLPVNVHDYDLCFQNWAKFDFSLSKNSRALNNGTSELAPKLDASLNKRSLGNFVNIGAFEFTKINESNQTFTIIAEVSDRQIHSKGKGDWDGQPQIRVGGVGEGIDGAGVFPFELPIIPGGKEILSVDFKVYLKKIDNKPQGGIDLYGLAPKSNYWVAEEMYYQGTFGQDLKARPIQNNYVGFKHFGGEVKAIKSGKEGLKSYINTVLENGSKAGDYIFLRMNPNARDVTDYNRWSFISANSDKIDKHPKLEIKLGYPALSKIGEAQLKEIKNIIVSSSNPMDVGNVNLYFLGFENENPIELKLFTYKGKEVLKRALKFSEIVNGVFRTENLNAETGKYLLEYSIEGVTKKQTVFIW